MNYIVVNTRSIKTEYPEFVSGVCEKGIVECTKDRGRAKLFKTINEACESVHLASWSVCANNYPLYALKATR